MMVMIMMLPNKCCNVERERKLLPFSAIFIINIKITSKTINTTTYTNITGQLSLELVTVILKKKGNTCRYSASAVFPSVYVKGTNIATPNYSFFSSFYILFIYRIEICFSLDISNALVSLKQSL